MSDDVPVGRLLTVIVAVLAGVLVLALAGLVALGAAGGDPDTQRTLTHIIETVLGVFIGIAAGKLASND